MGEKLDYFKFRNVQNPLGILFHPKAIENLMLRALDQKHFEEEALFYHNERWHCFDAHSDLSQVSKVQLLQDLNHALGLTNRQIRVATHILLTLGTAWCYRHKKTDVLVANCHKVPQGEFNKELLSIASIVKSLQSIIERIRSVNSKAQVIFTVSPVRHLKDGFMENQRSKAHLLAAVHECLEMSSLDLSLTYFPSFEILMDELRDYRFYKEDMVHPNPLAVAYIWEKFREAWISKTVYSEMDKVDLVQKGLAHLPFNPDSQGYQKFKKSLQGKITYLKRAYPFMEF